MSAVIVRVTSVLTGIRLSVPVISVYGLTSFVGAGIALSATSVRTWSTVVIAIGVTSFAILCLLGVRHLLGGGGERGPLGNYMWFVLAAFIIGTARGLLLAIWASQWDETLVDGPLTQVLNSAFSAVVWLTLAGLLFASRERYRQRYRSLLIQGAARSPMPEGTEADLDAHPTVVQVKSHLAAAVEGSAESPSPADLLRVSEAIRNEIETNVRPLSHRLWFSADGEEPHVRWSRLLRDALAGFTVPIGVVSLIWFAGGLVGGSRLFGFADAILATALSTVLLAGMLVLGTRVVHHAPRLGLVWALASSIVPIFVSDIVLSALGIPSRLIDGSVLTVLLPLALLSVIVSGAAISLANSDRTVVLELAARRQMLPLVSGIDPHQLSTYLHNSLQSELTGLAMQLEAAAQSGGEDEAHEALERVYAMLSRSVSDDFAGFAEDPGARALRVSSGWQGICDVTFVMAAEVTDDPRLAAAIQIAEEIIANAVRHAGATEVRVEIELSGTALRVGGLVNRAVTMAGAVDSRGMGMKVIHALSPSGMSTEAEGEGTRFEVLVP